MPIVPPPFIMQAKDDPVDDKRYSTAYTIALRAKKVPVELHVYAHGGQRFRLTADGAADHALATLAQNGSTQSA